jgi:DNA modification methylase/ParB-like chromosome segregation protein Spo0J
MNSRHFQFDEINFAKYNPRVSLKPADKEYQDIRSSLQEFGYLGGGVVNVRTNTLVGGHQRVTVMRDMGQTGADFATVDLDPIAEKRLNLILNKVGGRWHTPALEELLNELQGSGVDLESLGFKAEELDNILKPSSKIEAARRTLAERFMVPPFSVLNAREGWWQTRKEAWINLGIQSELGRGAGAEPGGSKMPAVNKSTGRIARSDSRAKAIPGTDAKRNLTWVQGGSKDETSGKILASGRRAGSEVFGTHGNASDQTGTSIFDPVLTELCYRWFCPPTGTILDPFAGGSVRGIVANYIGRDYHGIDLRPEQVAANVDQAKSIFGRKRKPTWTIGDSSVALNEAPPSDFVFSCPPYADLEVYSDDPSDLSVIAKGDYRAFLSIYRDIIAKSMARLKNNRFACFVVGEVRDQQGNYRDFVGDTIQAFRDAGAEYYNEAILVTAAGSLPIRAGKQFDASRKLGKTHQNVLVFQKGLVFVKGSGKKAAGICGEVQVDESLFWAEVENAAAAENGISDEPK